MPRYPQPREFDARTPKAVRRPFRFAGRDYSPGEPFPWKRIGATTRQVQQLYLVGKLKDVDAPEEVEASKATIIETEAPKKPIDPPVIETDDLPDNMSELRFIAELEGAPIKRSKTEQKAAILEHRADG